MSFLAAYVLFAVTETDYSGVRGIITAATPVLLAVIALWQWKLNNRQKRIDREQQVAIQQSEKTHNIVERRIKDAEKRESYNDDPRDKQ